MTARETATVQALRAGARGFDTAQKVSTSTARAFKAAGYDFVYRYIWRERPHPFDLTTFEIETILAAGLGLGIVQHYAGDGWKPDGPMGARYGATAADACEALGIPAAVTVFCDLEGVAHGTPADLVDQYARAWSFGYSREPGMHRGLYVGDSCVLDAGALYRLPFECYWRALNLNDDQIPPVRGFAMRQHVTKLEDIPFGVGMTTADFDVDTVSGDALGGFPFVLMPAGA